ncbi:hypothetical protein BSKO_13072 [Bryopsis sp. KO-2023]|nr:hypothetical protein BSKO_13072 [Bryopsis sp. KO-2023]
MQHHRLHNDVGIPQTDIGVLTSFQRDVILGPCPNAQWFGGFAVGCEALPRRGRSNSRAMQAFHQQTRGWPLLRRTASKFRNRVYTTCRSQVREAAPAMLKREIRNLPMRVLLVGKQNSRGAQLMADEWLEKVQRYTKLSEVKIKSNPKNTSQPTIQMQEEGKKVLQMLSGNEYIVVLDERGREVSTAGMVNLIADAADQGLGLTFCIGGPYGHAQDVRNRANKIVKLSPMVLNHEVARIVLYEQIYRAWTILKGHPYHH